MLTRRQFLAAAPVLAGAATGPLFWRRVAQAAAENRSAGASERVLVVIELTGGNDGLNTIVPWRDPVYRAARPTLAQPAGKVRRINDELAFHPALAEFAQLLEQSRLSIVQGVGYPNPNRSHFESLDIWYTASQPADKSFGWLGRASTKSPSAVGPLHVGAGELPLALAAPSGRAVSLQSLAEYQLRVAPEGDDPQRRRLLEEFAAGQGDDSRELLAIVRGTARETYSSAARLRAVGERYDTPISYPSTGLAGRLKLIAQLITAGVPERLFYTALGGFDTHADQSAQHAALLAELGDAVAAFLNDLTHQGQHERVLTITFSEFGRRVRENGSAGTDHGAASQMFVAGPKLKPGPIGAHPSLVDLDDGDLKQHTDFRSVYATLLEGWLGVSGRDVLGADYPRIELFAS